MNESSIFIMLLFFLFPINNSLSINDEYFIKLFQGPQKNDNKIKDTENDTKLVTLYKSNIVPEIHDYHDILSAEVNKIDNKFFFTMKLDGDANTNKIHESVYIWLIYDVTIISQSNKDDNNSFSMSEEQNQIYTLIIPNFGKNSKFEKDGGWYLAIFNNTNNTYTLPISKISDMPTNKVQVFVDPIFIGNPLKFNYIVSSMIRVNNTFLDKPPDYLIDVVPNNYESFWIKWFKK